MKPLSELQYGIEYATKDGKTQGLCYVTVRDAATGVSASASASDVYDAELRAVCQLTETVNETVVVSLARQWRAIVRSEALNLQGTGLGATQEEAEENARRHLKELRDEAY